MVTHCSVPLLSARVPGEVHEIRVARELLSPAYNMVFESCPVLPHGGGHNVLVTLEVRAGEKERHPVLLDSDFHEVPGGPELLSGERQKAPLDLEKFPQQRIGLYKTLIILRNSEVDPHHLRHEVP